MRKAVLAALGAEVEWNRPPCRFPALVARFRSRLFKEGAVPTLRKVLLVLLAVVAFAGCGAEGDRNDLDSGTGDSDSDTDSDTDGDTDSDTDLEDRKSVV